MISIIYLSVVVTCALAAGGITDKNNNLRRAHIEGGEDEATARDVGLTYKAKGVQWAKQQVISEQSIYQMSVRGDESFDDAKEQADLDWFLKTIKDTPEYKNCRTGIFACTEFSSHLLGYLKHLGQTDVANLGTFSTNPAVSTTLSTYEGPTEHLSQSPKQLSAYALRFSDPEWRKQWYMQDYRTFNYPVMDHNVVPLYDMDITGFTVTVGVLGDGVMEHADLGDNYAKGISYDFCEDKAGSSPSFKVMKKSGRLYDTLGTSSAGVIAMKPNNGLCGVGIAHGARIAGLRMSGCDYPKSNMEANALKYNLEDINIYCNTWTIEDKLGEKLVELSYPVESALKMGTSDGRNKKGAIYVFPSGINGWYSNCAFNGYLNNPYVITIASAASDGKFSLNSERCSAVFAAAYSGDTFQDTEDVMTISANGGCKIYPEDKPVAPAVASGIFALVLQYKSSLTYRDMMHLIAMTAEVAPLANNKNSWYRNGRGLWVSNDFGFGLLNAKNMIDLAKDWKTVPEKHICTLSKKFDEPLYFDNPNSQTVTVDGTECKGQGKSIKYLEHVELISTIDYTFRGAVYINITSPAKTNTAILEPRLKDYYKNGIKGLNIMSVHNWGENPRGTWAIAVMAVRITGSENPHGYIHELTLKLHGTKEMPNHYNQARKYAAFRLPNGNTNMYV